MKFQSGSRPDVTVGNPEESHCLISWLLDLMQGPPNGESVRYHGATSLGDWFLTLVTENLP